LTFYSVSLQRSYMRFEIEVGGEFPETMPPSLNDGLEASIIWNAPFAAGFLGVILKVIKEPECSISDEFLRLIISKLIMKNLN
jgi:hypothetical protein